MYARLSVTKLINFAAFKIRRKKEGKTQKEYNWFIFPNLPLILDSSYFYPRQVGRSLERTGFTGTECSGAYERLWRRQEKRK